MVANFAKVSISQSFIIPKIQGNKSEKEKKTFELIQTIVEDKRECVEEPENSVEKAKGVEEEAEKVEQIQTTVEILSEVGDMTGGSVNKSDEQMQDGISDKIKEDELLKHIDENVKIDFGHVKKPSLNICAQDSLEFKSEKSDQMLTEGFPDFLVAAMVIFAALLWFNC